MIMEAIADEIEVFHAEEVVEVVGRNSVLSRAIRHTALSHSLILAALGVVMAESCAVPHVSDSGPTLLTGGQVGQNLE